MVERVIRKGEAGYRGGRERMRETKQSQSKQGRK